MPRTPARILANEARRKRKIKIKEGESYITFVVISRNLSKEKALEVARNLRRKNWTVRILNHSGDKTILDSGWCVLKGPERMRPPRRNIDI